MFLSQPPSRPGIEALRADHVLDRVRDHFAGQPARPHAGRAHRDAVDTVMVPNVVLLPPAALAPLRRRFGQLIDVHVARREVAPRRSDCRLRLLEIRPPNPDCTEHRPAGRLLGRVEHESRIRRVSTLRRHIEWTPGGKTSRVIVPAKRVPAVTRVCCHLQRCSAWKR